MLSAVDMANTCHNNYLCGVCDTEKEREMEGGKKREGARGRKWPRQVFSLSIACGNRMRQQWQLSPQKPKVIKSTSTRHAATKLQLYKHNTRHTATYRNSQAHTHTQHPHPYTHTHTQVHLHTTHARKHKQSSVRQGKCLFLLVKQK